MKEVDILMLFKTNYLMAPVQHLVKMFDVPYSTCETIVKKYLTEYITEVQLVLLNAVLKIFQN